MAKIKKSEIIEEGILSEHIKQLEQVLGLNKKIDAQIKQTAATRKASIGGVDPNTSKGIRQINSEVANSIKLKKAVIAQDKKQAQLNSQLKAATDEQVKGKLRLAEATRKQKEILKEEIALENKQIGTLNKLAIANKRLNREKKALDLTTAKGTKRLKEINAEMNKNTAIVTKNATANGKLKANIGNYPKALGGATAGLKKFAGALGLTSGIFLLIKGIKGSINTMIDFEQGNANLASILGKTSDKIVRLTDDAKRLGSATSFSATEVSTLQTEFAKLGFNENEIINATEATLNLAAATGSDLAESAAIAGATLGGFGLDASETARVTDVMAKSFSTSALDMEKFKESMKDAAPAAKAVGVDIEKTTALLGTLSNAGISGSKAGSALKAGFIELNAAGIGLDESLQLIANSNDKLATATELVGKRAATSFLVLADGVAVTNDLEEGLRNAGGAAQTMADTQLDTLGGSIKLLKSAWEGIVLSFADGTGILGGLKDAIKFVANNLTTIIKVIGFVTKGFIAFKTVMFALKMGDRAKEWMSFRKEVKKGGTALDDAGKKAKGFGKALKGIGLALAITVLLELATAFYDIASGAAEARRQEDLFNEANNNSSKFAEKFNQVMGDRIKKRTQELQLLVAAGEMTQANMDIELKDMQMKKGSDAMRVVEISKGKIKNLRDENIQLQINSDLNLKAIKNNSNLRGFEKVEQQNAARTILSAALRDNNNQIVQQNSIITEFTGIAETSSDATHDYTVRIAENSRAVRTNTTATKEQVKSAKELLDQKLKDLRDNLSESLKMVENNALKEGKTKEEIDEILRLKNIENLKKENEFILENYGEFSIEYLDINLKLNKELAIQKEDDSKNQKELDQQLFEDVLNQNIDNALTLRNELIKQGKSKEEIDKELSKKNIERLKSEKDLALKMFGESSVEFIKADRDLNNALFEQREKAATERLQTIKENVQTTVDLLEIVINNLGERIDNDINKANDRISESETAVSNLQEQANLGNLDAEASIKAEKNAIANEKLNIEALEKKKRNLQILVTGLAVANEKIQSGDGNALGNASSDMQTFISTLKGFYDGTETTLGNDLGNAYAIKGDKDTHIIKAHKDEHIIGVNNSRKLGNMSQSDIVKGALMLKNGEFMGNRVVNSMASVNEFNDSRMVEYQQQTIKAINNIKIPEHHFNYDAINKVAIETVKLGNKITNNSKKIGGKLF